MSHLKIKENFEKYFKVLCEKENWDYKEMINVFFTYHKTAIRVNTLYANSNEIKRSLESKSFKFRPIPWINDAFFVDKKPYAIGSTLEHSLGLIYVQDASSMLPSIILDPQPNETILDIAAAPGSKTTHIAMLMKNTGVVVANDVSVDRLNVLAMNVQRMGLKNVVINRGNGMNFDFMTKFDRILVDAPCTATGTIRVDETSPMKQWSKKAGQRLAKTQLKLLSHAWKFLKPKGILVYSTCSIDPIEDELVLHKFLQRHDATLLPIELDLPTRVNSITEYNGTKLDERIKNALRILPHTDYEGFFIAKLQKP